MLSYYRILQEGASTRYLLGQLTKRKAHNISYCRRATSKQSLINLPSLCCDRGVVVQTSRKFSSVVNNLKENRLLSNGYDICLSLETGYKTNGLLNNIPSTFFIDSRSTHDHRSTNQRASRRRGLKDLEDDPFSVELDSTTPHQQIESQKKHFTTYDESTKENGLDNLTAESRDLSHQEHEKISKIFPTPRVTLNNLVDKLSGKFFEVTHKQASSSKGKHAKLKSSNGPWTSTYVLRWPSPMKIEAIGHTKQLAATKAAYKVIHILYNKKHIDEHGLPIYDKEFIDGLKKELNKPLAVKIDSKDEEKIKHLIAGYNSKIAPLLEDARAKLQNVASILPSMPADLTANELDEEVAELNSPNVHNLSVASQMEFRDTIFSIPLEKKNKSAVYDRNQILLDKFVDAKPESPLPITKFKEKIVSTVAANRAVVIRGAPGCGKSTRTPAYILEAAASAGAGAGCNILVSQPRRVAALALAERVADEREEEVGDVIGHQVRLSTKIPKAPGGVIVYCTAGALLRRLASSPELLGCSHLILDEAHERSADSDAVMSLAKRAMILNPKLKVIIMSATIDTELFSKYYDNCPVLDIPGFTYPVKSFFLEDFAQKLNLSRTLEMSNREDGPVSVDTREVTEMIKWVHSTKPEGAILCFLPGWQEIRKVRDNMEFQKIRGALILPVHSRLSNEDQKKIFSKPPYGMRKIILATNIAETSITIDDVSYVIDTGVHKEHKLMDNKGISSLDNNWISKASVSQRRGRAGRVKPGESYHLYTKARMESFTLNAIPEILRVPLEKTVMDCKTYSVNEKAKDFLGQFPQPPTPEAIELAVNDLINMGALDENEQLTALGRRIATFTTHPKISKALIHSTVFKVISPVVDLSTILSNNIDLFSCAVNEVNGIRRTKEQHHPTSDHMALYWLTQKYQEIREHRGYREADQFCKKVKLRIERMKSVYDLRKICVEHLQQSRMLPPNIGSRNENFGEDDRYRDVDELIKGVLLSGLNTMLHIKNIIKTKGKITPNKEVFSDQGQHAFISSSSVNHNIHKRNESGALLYCGAVHSTARRGLLVRDTSYLQPITVFLFSQKIRKCYQNDTFTVFDLDNKKIKLQCPPEHADLLLEFHKIIWSIVQYYIENRGFVEEKHRRYSALDDHSDNDDMSQRKFKKNSPAKTIDEFRDALVKTVAQMLSDAEIETTKSIPSKDNYDDDENDKGFF